MAFILKRKIKGDKHSYEARWRDGTGKQHVKTFRLRKDAQRFLNKTTSAVDDGSFQKTQPTRMKNVFAEWVVDLETRVKLGEVRASTAATSKCGLRVHLAPEVDGVEYAGGLGAYRSDKLTPRVMAKWRATLAEKVEAGEMAQKTFNNVFTLARQIFAWAQHPARAYVVRDPLAGQKRLTLRKKEAEFLEDDDMAELLAAASSDGEANALVHLMLFGGLRRGEAFALQWNDVEVEEHGGRLRVRRSLYGGVVTPTKTANSERVVDVPGAVLGALNRHRDAMPPIDGDFIFRTRTGQPLDPNSWYSRVFKPLRERAGLRNGVGLHALRHTFASLLIRNGENPKYVSAQLGHSSTSFTMDTYGHLFESTSMEAMARMEKVARSLTRQHLRVVGGTDAS